MDYTKKRNEMMLHLGQNYSQQEFARFVGALSNALAKTLALIENHDQMHSIAGNVLAAIETKACQEHALLHPMPTFDAETFLRDEFHPETFNG